MRKDFADLFAAEGQEALETLHELKSRAADALDLAVEGIPDVPSKRERLKYIRESVFPLVLGLPREADRLAALEDVVAVAKVKASVLRRALDEEQSRLQVETLGKQRAEAAASAAVPEEEYARLLEPGVVERYVEAAALAHCVVGDREPAKLLLLAACGAQLLPLPNGKPLGASVMLVGEAGRGKNHVTDAVVGLLPPEWCLAFESASAASMYYRVADDPDFLRHRFVYPNEAEAADMLVEFMRPMLSAGKAVRLTVNNTGPNGANEAQELEVWGPITTVIPTVRNKLDGQLQTRLLVAELEDYEGRVRTHSRAFSRLLLPGYVGTDGAEAARAWGAALRTLTKIRRVVFPLDHEGFALDNDGVSHGARLWANLLGLMCAHAWLEQRNREVVELPAGESAVAATPEDYEAAYRLFEATSQRTVVNLSDTHRRILNALHELRQADLGADGFSQRAIAERAGLSQPAVAKHKTFLATSVKLVREADGGLALVDGAEPAWWASEGLMRGFPSPEKVRGWFDAGRLSTGPAPRDRREPRDRTGAGASTDRRPEDRSDGSAAMLEEALAPDPAPATSPPASKNGSGKPGTDARDTAITPITAITVVEDRENGVGLENGSLPPLTAEDALAEMRIPGSGPARVAYACARGQTRLRYLVRAVLVARGLDADDWERHVSVVAIAFRRWKGES